MPIERSLTSEQFQALPEIDKPLYEANDSGGYTFNGGNVGALKRAKDHEVAKRRDVTKELESIKKQLASIESAKAEAEHNKTVETQNNEALNKSWQEKYDKAIAKEQERSNKLQESIRRSHRETVIENLTNELSVPKFAHLVKPMIEKRIDVKLNDDGLPQTIIKDTEGKETANTIKDLTEELRGDKRNADVLKDMPVGSGTTDQPKSKDLQVRDPKVEPSPFEGLGYQPKLSKEDNLIDEFRRVVKTTPQRVTEFAKYIPELPPSDF